MKKTIAFLLSLLMLAALFSGCSQQSASTAPESQAPATEAPESQAPIDAAPESAAPETQEPQAEGVDLTILYEADDDMINNYSLLAVNPDAPFVDADGNPVSDVYVNTEGAAALINWMLSEEGKAAIADYGYADYGEYLFYLIEDGPASTAEVPAATDETRVIRMSTTTSVNDSGLLAYLLPLFEEAYGYTVEVTSAGTGRAIANAESGNADLLLVHSKSQEEEFIAGGYSYVLPGFESERLTFMYNYFVLCGPSSDPAGAKDAASVRDAFAAIAEGKYPFVSRGDQSGTHTKEISLWPEDLGITVDAASVEAYSDWYTYSNAGMGVCLTMAEELGAYILSDKATFLTFQANNGTRE